MVARTPGSYKDYNVYEGDILVLGRDSKGFDSLEGVGSTEEEALHIAYQRSLNLIITYQMMFSRGTYITEELRAKIIDKTSRGKESKLGIE